MYDKTQDINENCFHYIVNSSLLDASFVDNFNNVNSHEVNVQCAVRDHDEDSFRDFLLFSGHLQ